MDNTNQKFYSLPMFPYPSGTAMHVGHASNFLVTEIMARYHRMRGDQVVFPIGYDSFGLPTENFAIKNNKSARQSTEDNIVYFEEQLKGIDFSFDEDRKFKTSDPEYYKWTQWIFTKLYQHNLVYRKDGLVNWCNGCQTVLANDQVVDGRCERCETEIIQKKHPQWYIKITDYADQLLDYSDCDRPEETKIHQTNWIGKSQGAEISFMIADDRGMIADDDKSKANSDLTYKIIGCAYKVHKELGSGLSEKIYHNAMKVALQNEGLKISTEEKIEYSFDGQKVGVGFMDLVVEGSIVLELKSRKEFQAENYKQLRAYMNQGNYETGLLLNFYNNKVETKRLDSNHHLISSEKIISYQESQSSDIIGENHPTSIVVFTTRPDTVYGVTAIVLAPENDIIDQYMTDEKKSELANYRKTTALKTNIERQSTDKDKTGFDSGVQVVHPLTGELVPVWFADYVLPDYATGAVMFVPAHDERDWEFASKYNMPSKQVIVPEFGEIHTDEVNIQGVTNMLFDPETQLYGVLNDTSKDGDDLWLITGGMDDGEDPVAAARREIAEEVGYYDFRELVSLGTYYSHYYHPKKQDYRKGLSHNFLGVINSHDVKSLKLEAHETFEISWVTPQQLLSNIEAKKDTKHRLYFVKKAVNTCIEMGLDTTNTSYEGNLTIQATQESLIDSDTFDGLDNITAKAEITKHLESIGKGKAKITYRLRDWSVSRQRYWGSPIPVYYTFEDNQKVLYLEYKTGNKVFQEGLPVLTRNVIQIIVKDKNSDNYAFIKWKHDGDVSAFFGGIEDSESHVDAAIRELREEGGFTDVTYIKEICEYHLKFYHPTKNRNQYSICSALLFEADLNTLVERSDEDVNLHEVVIMSDEEFLSQSHNDTSIFVMNELLGKQQTIEYSYTDRYNAHNPHPDKTKWIPHLIPESELPVILPLDLPNYKPAGKSPLEDHPTFKYYTKKESALLIHGRGNKPGDGNCLDAISQDLISKGYEVIYPELDYHATFSFEDVLSKLQSYHANIVIGHSSGGYLARHYASRNTVDQIITISSTSESTVFDDDFVSSVTQWLGEEDGKKYIEFHSHHIDFTHMLQNPPKAIDVFGEQDAIINESIREWFVLFNSTTILPGRGHMGTDESSHDYSDLLALINIAPARDITYLRECDTLDTFMCSSFYFLRFCDPHNTDQLISPEAAKMMPVDLYVGGKEHTVGHLLYSRFIYKFLKDIGAVACESKEPFRKLVHQGMVHASDGRKMSKRWGNVIDPMGIINEYGSDTLRTYTMFMGPVEASKNWNPDAVAGVYRFIGRVAKLREKIAVDGNQIAVDGKNDAADSNPLKSGKSTEILSILHQTIKGVTEDIEALKFNTAVSKLMIMTNAFAEAKTINQSDYLIFLKLCAPFATHMTQQIWSELGQEGSIHDSSWPVWDDALIATGSIDLPIQVNGKMRGTIAVASGAAQDEVIALARSHDNIAKWLEGEIIKIIYVQDKICNVIIKYSESH